MSRPDPAPTNVPHAGGRYIAWASTYRRITDGRALRVRRLPTRDCAGDSLATARIAFLTLASLSEDRVVPRHRLTGRIHRGSLRRSLRRWRPAVRCAHRSDRPAAVEECRQSDYGVHRNGVDRCIILMAPCFPSNCTRGIMEAKGASNQRRSPCRRCRPCGLPTTPAFLSANLAR